MIRADQPTTAALTRGDIEEGLRTLGLGPGVAAEVHSSLSSLGWVDGGAAAVVDALMNVVGPHGSLIMSAYPVSRAILATEEERARGIKVKVRIFKEGSSERTGLGAIVEEFTKRPGSVMGTGLHRVCAWGHDAELHGKGYQHLVDVDGSVLLIGVGIGSCSSMHLVSDRVPLPDKIAQYFTIPADILRDYPPDRWAIAYGDGTPKSAWDEVWEEAKRQGKVHTGKLGKGECHLFRVRDMLGIYEEWLRRDPFGLFGVQDDG